MTNESGFATPPASNKTIGHIGQPIRQIRVCRYGYGNSKCEVRKDTLMPFEPPSPDYSADVDADEMVFAEICAAVEDLVYSLVRSKSGVDDDSTIGALGIEDELRDIVTDVTAKHWCKDSSGAIADRDEYDDYTEYRLRQVLGAVVGEVYDEAAYRIEKKRSEERAMIPTRYERAYVI